MTRQLGARVSPEAGLAGAVAILPTGACEAHGPHLPLDTDVRIAVAMAEGAAARLANAVVLPPLTYGIAKFARNFPGTLSIPAELVTGWVTEVLCAAHAAGARGLAVANAHLEPAQVDALFAACEQVKARTGVAVAFPNVGSKRNAERLAARVAPLDGHAGLYETALVLAVSPDRVVGHTRLADVEASLAAGIRAGATCFEEAGGPDGYFGTPGKATAAIGDALLDELAAILVEAMQA
ncbi:MAG: creatininase family protein [Myxococcota bacterium]